MLRLRSDFAERKPIVETTEMLIVQHIETTWNKNERGAMHGTLRGKTPLAAPIPTERINGTAEGTLVHSIQLARASSEVHEKVQMRSGRNIHIGRVRVEPLASGAVVDFTWDYRSGGRRGQSETGRKAWELNRNEWCRIRSSERLALEDTWQYVITTLNIGVFDEIAQDSFETGTPNFQFENLVRFR